MKGDGLEKNKLGRAGDEKILDNGGVRSGWVRGLDFLCEKISDM